MFFASSCKRSATQRNPTMRKLRTGPCGQTLNRGSRCGTSRTSKNDVRVQGNEVHWHDDGGRSQGLLPFDDICNKKVKIVKKPRCGITKLMKLQTSGDDDDSKSTVRIEFARCGEQAPSNSSGSTGENDRMNEKSEWDTKSCDAGTDVAYFFRMRCVDDVMYHVVKNQDLELDMNMVLSVVYMFDE